MVSNSFKFLALALAAALTVAPISAIDWSSKSTRVLARFGFAIATLVGVMVYNYFSAKNKVTLEDKEKFFNILENNLPNEDIFVNKILNRLNDRSIDINVQRLSEIRQNLIKTSNDNEKQKINDSIFATLSFIRSKLELPTEKINKS